ncbi:MAG: CAF17-like 4Fe-4S cluster assembly/insertion protein YgfZ [Micrococcaceae bacterium]
MSENPGTGSTPTPILGSGIDAPVAAHYGQPHAEQRALEQGTAVVDLSHRGVVTVSGPDRLSWLHVLTSQDVASLRPGVSTEMLFLDLRGRLEFDVALVDDGATAWLIVEPGLSADLTAWLDAMRFASRVEVTDRSAEIAVVGATAAVPGWGAAEDATLSVHAVWEDPWPQIAPGGFPYSADPDPQEHPGADWSWREYLIDRAELSRVPGALPTGWRLAGTLSSEALRIAAARPRQLVDTDERSIPHELDLLRTAVHLTKGCYKGQETVARVHNLGHPPRRLVQLLLDGSVHGLPEPGSEVVVRDPEAESSALETARSVGTVTSVAHHHEMGPIGLAIIKRNVAPDAELVVRQKDAEGAITELVAASQQVLVSPEAGNVVGRPQGGFLRGARKHL